MNKTAAGLCAIHGCYSRGTYQVVTEDGSGAVVRMPSNLFCQDHWWNRMEKKEIK